MKGVNISPVFRKGGASPLSVRHPSPTDNDGYIDHARILRLTEDLVLIAEGCSEKIIAALAANQISPRDAGYILAVAADKMRSMIEVGGALAAGTGDTVEALDNSIHVLEAAILERRARIEKMSAPLDVTPKEENEDWKDTSGKSRRDGENNPREEEGGSGRETGGDASRQEEGSTGASVEHRSPTGS